MPLTRSHTAPAALAAAAQPPRRSKSVVSLAPKREEDPFSLGGFFPGKQERWAWLKEEGDEEEEGEGDEDEGDEDEEEEEEEKKEGNTAHAHAHTNNDVVAEGTSSHWQTSS